MPGMCEQPELIAETLSSLSHCKMMHWLRRRAPQSLNFISLDDRNTITARSGTTIGDLSDKQWKVGRSERESQVVWVTYL